MCKPYGCFSDVPLAAEPLLPNPFSSFLLCPALLSPVTALQCLLTSLFQLSFLKMFYLHSFASFPFFPLPLPSTVLQEWSPLQQSKANLHKFPSEPVPVTFCPHFLLPVTLCCYLQLSGALLFLAFCSVCSNTRGAPLWPPPGSFKPFFLQLLMSCRPMAQICRSSPHVNTSMTRCCLEAVAASYKPALGVVFTRTK